MVPSAPATRRITVASKSLALLHHSYHGLVAVQALQMYSDALQRSQALHGLLLTSVKHELTSSSLNISAIYVFFRIAPTSSLYPLSLSGAFNLHL
jgi:hypothetical protein